MAVAGTEMGGGREAAGGAVLVALAALDAGARAEERREILLSVAVLDHFRTLRFQDLQNGRCPITYHNSQLKVTTNNGTKKLETVM